MTLPNPSSHARTVFIVEQHESIDTKSLGAPECDSKRYATRTPLSQTIDTWSFGCVLSSVATWVVLGSQAYENYNERRTIAINALQNEKAKDTSTSVPTCENAFHDGRSVLPAVTEWHIYLRNSARRADTTTHRVLDLVDRYMLQSNPEKRVMMGELCDRLDDIILCSRREYQQKLEEDFLRPVGTETLRALQELDDLAPRKAAVAQAARVEVEIKNRSEYGGPSQTEAVDDKLERPSRPRKSERFDKIVFAKTANRVQNSQLLTEISESPTQLPEGTHLGSDHSSSRDKKKQEEIPDIRLDGSDSPSVEEPSSLWSTRERTVDVLPYKTTSPESLSPNLPDTRGSSQPQRPDGNSIVLENRQKDVQSLSTASDESFKAMPSGAFELPGSGVAGKSIMAAGPSHMPILDRKLRSEESSGTGQISGHERDGPGSLLILGGNDPELGKTAIFQEYTLLQKNWGDKKKSLFKRIQGVPQDERLQRFISKRDIVRLASAPQPTFHQANKTLTWI